jgi:hypothetical protein
MDFGSFFRKAVGKEDISDFAGWSGGLGRLDAEHRLHDKPPGTYLLREGDEITLQASFHFAEENHLLIHPYVLTVVEKEGKVSDLLLLKTDKGWLLYHDDPDLQTQNYYRSARELILSIENIARYPLI